MPRRALAGLLLFLLAGCGAPTEPEPTTVAGGHVDDDSTPPTIRNPSGSSPAQLYVHPFANRAEPMALNTQRPDYGFVQDMPLPGPEVGCEPVAATSTVRWLAYSSPGYVQYNETGTDGKPRVHDEAQLGGHLRIDHEQPLRLIWHLAATREAGGQGPLALPDVTVRARLRERTMATDQEGWNEGEVLAQGEASGTLAGPATTSRIGNVTWNGPANTANGRWIYTFEVDLAQPAEIFIPRSKGFTLEVEATMPGDCVGGFLVERTLEAHFGPEHDAVLALHAFDAVAIEYLHPIVVGDELVIHAGMRSAWGTYDLDAVAVSGTAGTKGGVEVTISGPSEARSLRREAFVDPGRGEGRHSEPVQATYVWPYKEDGAQAGEYTVFLTATNDQHTAAASAEASIRLP